MSSRSRYSWTHNLFWRIVQRPLRDHVLSRQGFVRKLHVPFFHLSSLNVRIRCVVGGVPCMRRSREEPQKSAGTLSLATPRAPTECKMQANMRFLMLLSELPGVHWQFTKVGRLHALHKASMKTVCWRAPLCTSWH